MSYKRCLCVSRKIVVIVELKEDWCRVRDCKEQMIE